MGLVMENNTALSPLPHLPTSHPPNQSSKTHFGQTDIHSLPIMTTQMLLHKLSLCLDLMITYMCIVSMFEH